MYAKTKALIEKLPVVVSTPAIEPCEVEQEQVPEATTPTVYEIAVDEKRDIPIDSPKLAAKIIVLPSNETGVEIPQSKSKPTSSKPRFMTAPIATEFLGQNISSRFAKRAPVENAKNLETDLYDIETAARKLQKDSSAVHNVNKGEEEIEISQYMNRKRELELQSTSTPTAPVVDISKNGALPDTKNAASLLSSTVVAKSVLVQDVTVAKMLPKLPPKALNETKEKSSHSVSELGKSKDVPSGAPPPKVIAGWLTDSAVLPNINPPPPIQVSSLHSKRNIEDTYVSDVLPPPLPPKSSEDADEESEGIRPTEQETAEKTLEENSEKRELPSLMVEDVFA